MYTFKMLEKKSQTARLSRKNKKKFTRNIAPYLVRALLNIIWKTCKVVKIEGEHHLETLINTKQPFIPVYWHQNHVYGAYLMLKLKKRGVNIGFLISPSVDGDMSAKIAESWGTVAVRGSSTRTGAKALRDLYQAMTKDNISPVNTSDGPTGPIHVFKPGAIMLAQLTKSELVPISYAASKYWQLKSWDKFIIPKPFAKIVITVGKPVTVDKTLSADELSNTCKLMQSLLLKLETAAKKILHSV